MKTIPDFTWEFIIGSCESQRRYMQEKIDSTSEEWHQRPKEFIRLGEVMMMVVAQLRAHPQLEKFVPMKSMMNLRWFPTNYEISLFCEYEDHCQITIMPRGDYETIVEQKVVTLDQVADEIYAYILKYDNP